MSGDRRKLICSRISLALLAVAALGGPVLNAQDSPPIRPKIAPDKETARPVAEVNERCEVVVEIGGEKSALALGDVVVPDDPALLAQLREFLSRLLVREDVLVRELEASPAKTGDARLAYLFRSPDGLFVNAEVVREGYAKARLDRESQYYEQFRDGQRRAKRAELGVWGPAPAPTAKPASELTTPAPVESGGTIVYVTKSGKKYHREDCRHLAKSSRAIALKEALAKGYEPCKVCKPPAAEKP